MSTRKPMQLTWIGIFLMGSLLVTAYKGLEIVAFQVEHWQYQAFPINILLAIYYYTLYIPIYSVMWTFNELPYVTFSPFDNLNMVIGYILAVLWGGVVAFLYFSALAGLYHKRMAGVIFLPAILSLLFLFGGAFFKWLFS
jgi:hypothetical protein